MNSHDFHAPIFHQPAQQWRGLEADEGVHKNHYI